VDVWLGRRRRGRAPSREGRQRALTLFHSSRCIDIDAASEYPRTALSTLHSAPALRARRGREGHMSKENARVTVVIAPRIRAGREKEYEHMLRDFVAWSLAQPGHEGLHVARPAPGKRDYTIVSRFGDEAARRAYIGSPEYASWMGRFAPLSEGDPRIQDLT